MFSTGVDLLADGRPEAALAEFEKSLAHAAGTRKADSLYNIAICHARLGRDEEALQAMRVALALDPALATEMETDADFATLASTDAYREILTAARSAPPDSCMDPYSRRSPTQR